MSFTEPGFIREATLLREQVENFDAYPFSIPAIHELRTLKLNPRVTFLVGENGTGKSTVYNVSTAAVPRVSADAAPDVTIAASLCTSVAMRSPTLS